MRLSLLLLFLAVHCFCSPRTEAFVDGIDVSHWQSTIDWQAVKADGIDFAFVKATDGVNYIDPKYHENMQGAIDAGVYVGPYHFARLQSKDGDPFTSYDGNPFAPGSAPYLDAVSEANDFLDAIMPYYNTGLHLPPVADIESLPDFGSTALNRQFISNWTELFSDTVNDTLGRHPIIYTSKFGANTRYTSEVAGSHDLWLAWWKNSTSNPPVESDTSLWEPWQFWQWTATGSVNGISGDVDRDVFDGTLQELEQILIGTGPPNPSDLVNITDFESDEGYFRWSTDYSGTNVGVGENSTAVRTDLEAHEGNWSQEIYIDGDSESWFYRHLAGESTPVANPTTNLALDATGSVGFWLKTDDTGMSVQIAIDDPQTADRGISQAILADGEWHLYEWDFSDDDQWEAWVNEEGVITGPTVTIDSIQFRGAGEATFFLDTVSHNPSGSLAPLVADFDEDGDVDADDFVLWQSSFGQNENADADNDGDTDGSDFLAWQRNLTPSSGQQSQLSVVPEPSAGLLLLLTLILVIASRSIPSRVTVSARG